MIAGTAFVWPGSQADADVPSKITLRIRAAQQKRAEQAAEANGSDGEKVSGAKIVATFVTPASDLIFGPFLPNFMSMAIGAVLAALVILVTGSIHQGLPENPVPIFILLVVVLGGVGIYRLQAGISALLASVVAILGATILCTPLIVSGAVPPGIISAIINHDTALYACSALAAIFLGLGFVKALVQRNANIRLTQVLSTVFIGTQIVVIALAYFAVGNFTRDWTFGLMTIIAGLFCVTIAEILHRRSEAVEASATNPIIGTYIVGSALNFIFAIHAVANGITTTLLVAALGFAYLLAKRLRPWTILPWIMGLADVVVMARIGWNPSIVSADALSTTPFFNALLPGYGIPTLLTALAAYDVRKGASESVRNFLQALASLGVLLTIAILVRHAMNGGVLDSTTPTLAEQSIYTLLAIGASAVMMTLDIKSPTPVFRWGSMAIGVVSILSIGLAHLLRLNPVFTGENTGSWPIVDLLLIGYLLPALAALGLAYYAEGKRPSWYRYLIEATGYILLFVWVPLELRHLFNGPILSSPAPIKAAEVFLWPLCWLGLSFALLAIGKYLSGKSAEHGPIAWYFPTFAMSLQKASLGFAGMAVLSLIFANLLYLNPYFSGESTGASAVFNLILLGYFVPAVLVWLRALIGRRGGENFFAFMGFYVFGIVLMFTYVTLVVRRAWQGEFIGSWNGFLQGETYTYSVVWLSLSLVLLAISRYLMGRETEPKQYSWYSLSFAMSLQRVSLGFAGITLLALIFANLTYKNPYFSGESTGKLAVFNLILLGYFAPAVLLWLRALAGRRSREHTLVFMGLSVSGLVLMFSYVTLTVRRAWQGEFIPSWNGFLQGETYTYSVVWLIFGVLLLVLGSRLNAISLRLASAAIVLLTVGKVFLFDMSNLEGILRALSFIGLGLVLIAIGMFYQRVLGNLALPKTGGAGTSDSDRDQSV